MQLGEERGNVSHERHQANPDKYFVEEIAASRGYDAGRIAGQ